MARTTHIYFDFNGVLAQKVSSQSERIATALSLNTDELKQFIDSIAHELPLRTLWKDIHTLEEEKRYNEELALLIFEQFSIPDSLDNRNKVINARFSGIFELLPGVLETVTQLSKTLKLGLLSNAWPSRRVYEFERLGLAPYFEPSMVILSTEVNLSKPNKEIFLYAIDKATVSPEHIAYIDDTLQYLEVARECGITSTYLVGQQSQKDIKTIPSISVLPTLFDALN